MDPVSVQNAAEQLAYATPAPSYGNKVWAGAAVLLGGLGLVLLGGCFLIGVLIVTTSSASMNKPLGPSQISFLVVLYGSAGGCFVCAAIVLLRGFRALFKVLYA